MIRSLATTAVLTLAALPSFAQTSYRLVDLTPPGLYGSAVAAANGDVAGSLTATANGVVGTHATLFTAAGAIDLHPAGLLDITATGRSTVAAADGGTLVGSGAGEQTSGRPIPLVWNGGVAQALPIPAVNGGAQATGIGGGQVVGWITPATLKRDVITFSSPHAYVWDLATGNAVDLHNGVDASYALGCAGGIQVGYGVKGFDPVAMLWRGTAASAVNLHPSAYATSQLLATDGVSQVGNVGIDRQIYVEKRGRRVRFSYAGLWRGTAASFQFLPGAFDHSWATGVAGDNVCGYGLVGTVNGGGGVRHAIAWTGPNHDATDLNQFLPAGFVSSTAYGVDAQGNVYGAMVSAAGESHAVVWTPLP